MCRQHLYGSGGRAMENKDTNIKIPLISKIAYGMRDVGCNFSWMFVGNFLMIFYTDVFGISMSAVAGLMLFSKMGQISSMASDRGSADRPYFDHFVLGASELVVNS